MQQVQTEKGTAIYETRGNRDAPTLVLFHTLLADCSVYDVIIDELADKFHVTRFHFPGYGGSTGECNTIDDYADWTAALFQSLDITKNGDKAVSVFSNGFGGFVSVGLCLRHPELVSHLVIANSGGAFPEDRKKPLHGMSQKVKSDGLNAVLDIAMSRMFPDDFRRANPEIISERKKKLLSADPEQFAKACEALSKLDYLSKANSIRCAVDVIAGMLDETTPPSMSNELYQQISQAKYHQIEDSGHCPQIHQPKKLLSLITKIL